MNYDHRAFSAAALLLILSIVILFRARRVAIDSQRRMDNQLEIISQLEQLASTVKDAETGQRGFLLTGDESYPARRNASLMISTSSGLSSA